MKHAYLKFGNKPKSYAPRMVTRRFPGLSRHGSSAYKSDGDDPDDEKDPEKKKLLDSVRGAVKKELETRGAVNKEDVDKIIKAVFEGVNIEALRSYKKSFDELPETVRTMAEKLEALSKRATDAAPERRKSIAAQLREHFSREKPGEAEGEKTTRSKWEAFKKREITNLSLELRVPAPITISANQPNTYVPGYEEIPGLIDLPRNRPFMMAISNVGTTNKPSVVWTEKTNPEGQAQFIGEGDLKPLIDFKYATKRESAKKVADRIETSEENLDDIDWMAAEIENELRYQIEIAVSTQLLTGDGLGDNLKGLDAYAGGYVLTTVETTDPNNADAIRAAIAQIRSLNFIPDLVVINPIDAANMELEKATDGHYIIPPFKSVDGTVISGVRVVEENGLPVGSVLVGDMRRFRVRIYKPLVIEYGWVNNQFAENMVTIRGEMRLYSFVATNDTGAFVYDTFANIKSAITAA